MIDDIKIFAADIDGTLLTKGGKMMPLTRNAIIKLHNNGVLVGPASGRPLDQSILNKAKEWDLGFDFDFAIGMNGGDLWTKESQKIQHFYQLQPEVIKEILNIIWDFDVNCIVYVNAYSHIRAKRMDLFLKESQKRNHSTIEIGNIDQLAEFPTGKIEVQMTSFVAPKFLETVNKHKSSNWTIVKTFDAFAHVTYEFMNPNCHKGVALKGYAESMNVDLKNVIAFGDEQNDNGMLETAGWGVCLKNGGDETKSYANDVTEHEVTDDGVGHYLEDHYFNKK